MWIWDYKIKRNWKPKNEKEWAWFLARRINYGEFKGLPQKMIKKLLPRIKKFLDPGKRAMLANFFKT